MPDTEVDLHVTDENLKTIEGWMSEGRFRIPEFQRDYVWKPSDVTSLFDSIYNSYPIGSVFLWEVSDEKEDFFREERDFGQPPIEDVGHQIMFVLDGQQRLSSMYIAVNGIEFQDYDYSKILFDVDAEEFTLGKPNAEHLVSVSDIWDIDKRYDVKDDLSQERSRRIDQCASRLENYKVPMLEVGSEDVDNVIDIFERINQKGRDLDRFDIVNANIWSPDFNLRTRIEKDINSHLSERGFGEVDRQTITQTLALVIDGSCTTSKQKSLDGEDVADCWNSVKEDFLNAVRYIEAQYNIKRVEFLPYEGLIAVLAYYLNKSGNETVSAEHQDQINRWFWRVVVSDHWESTRQTKMGKDAALMSEIIQGHDVNVDFPVTITPEKLINANIKRSNSKVRNAFLCLLAQKEPRNWEDGTKIDLQNNLYSKFGMERHHIYPNAYLRQEGYSKDMRKTPMDITFLPRGLNNSIGDRAPHVYLEDFEEHADFEEIMESHLIPVGGGAAIRRGDYETFLDERAKLFMSEIKELAGDFSGFDDQKGSTPMERVEQTEELVRKLLHERLTEEQGRYWGVMPADITQRVEERAGDEGLSGMAEEEKLEFVKMNECAKIIDIHWQAFDDVFPDSEDTSHHLSNLEAYKGELEDDEEAVDEYAELDGRLAIQWCNSCIQTAME